MNWEELGKSAGQRKMGEGVAHGSAQHEGPGAAGRGANRHLQPPAGSPPQLSEELLTCWYETGGADPCDGRRTAGSRSR